MRGDRRGGGDRLTEEEKRRCVERERERERGAGRGRGGGGG